MARRIAVILAIGGCVLVAGCPEFTANDAPTFNAPAAPEGADAPPAPPSAPPPAQGAPNAHARVALPAGAPPVRTALPTAPPNVRVIPAAAHGEGAP